MKKKNNNTEESDGFVKQAELQLKTDLLLLLDFCSVQWDEFVSR